MNPTLLLANLYDAHAGLENFFFILFIVSCAVLLGALIFVLTDPEDKQK